MLPTRIADAMRLAIADGRAPHHVSLSAADWGALNMPAVTLKPALKASASVLWAMDVKGFKLVPYVLSEAA